MRVDVSVGWSMSGERVAIPWGGVREMGGGLKSSEQASEARTRISRLALNRFM